MNSIIRKKRCYVTDCLGFGKIHSFPKDQQYQKLWLEAINQPHLCNFSSDELRKKRICDRHFEEEFIVSGLRGLRVDAVPSLNLPGMIIRASDLNALESMEFNDGDASMSSLASPSKTSSIFVASNQHDYNENEYAQQGEMPEPCEPREDNPPNDVTVPSCSSNPVVSLARGSRPYRRILPALGVTRSVHLSPNCRTLYRLVNKCTRKNDALARKCESYKLRVQSAARFSESFANLVNHVNPTTHRFIMQQVRTQKQAPRARRFSLDEKILALTVLKASGKGYRCLSKIFALPSRRTLTNLLNKLPFEAGINPQIFKSLKLSVKKMRTHAERCCVLLFDEIALASNVSYNQKADQFDGFQDLGNGIRKCALVDHANVFMVKGVFRQWKQPVAYTFTSGPMTSADLKCMITSVISNLLDVGLDVIATICDQGSANRAAINCLVNKSGAPSETNFSFLVKGKEIIPLYDVPHLFKGIRNNLLTKDLHFKQDGITKIARWQHIVDFYNLDVSENVRICPKLTDKHVIESKINKMKVSLCTQVFSHQVGSLMKRISSWGAVEAKLPKEAEQTADFILFIDELFDSLNANGKVAPRTKPLKGGITKGSGHENFWRCAIKLLDTAKFYCPKKKSFIQTTPSINNLKHTLRGMILVKASLLEKGFRYVLPRAFNQDPLENFFGNIRSHGLRNTSPSVTHFTSSYKALLVNNMMSTHSPAANCEEDVTCGTLDNLRCLITGEEVAGVFPLENPSTSSDVLLNIEIPPGIPLFKRSKVARCTLNYIAGYVANKGLIKFGNKCDTCKNILTSSDNDDYLDFIEVRQYRTVRFTKPGSYLRVIMDELVSKLLYLIPRLCNKLQVKEVLRTIIFKTVNLDAFMCHIHRELPNFIYTLTFRCIVFFWCRGVNRVMKGADSKFIKFMNNHPRIAVDPIKMQAHRQYLKKIKRKK